VGTPQEEVAEENRCFSSYEEACEAIAAFLPYLLAVARSEVGHDSVAEDLVQETLHNALRGWEGFRGKSSLKTWLTRILLNIRVSYWRRQKKLIGQVTLDPLLDPGLKSWWSNPVRVAMNHELRTFIGKTVKRMSPGQRKAFVRCDLKGATHEAAARRLRISRQALNTNLYRARRLLKRAVEDSEFAYIVRQRGPGNDGRVRAAG
jgi:RNA polymerase sigma-70 factor (ECF subfamily)